MKKITPYLSLLVVGILIFQACKTYKDFRLNYEDANKLIHNTKNIETKPFLKAHLKNGSVCILRDSWQIDTIANEVTGNGIRYDFNRVEEFEGDINIQIDSVAIFETNTKIKNPEARRITALSILTGLDVALGLFCISSPKACFGSCPTFYINEDDNFHYADAEGFSNAISPSMEYFDIDALNNNYYADGSFSITMKNEALETHCVKDVKIFAYPTVAGERVYQSPTNDFYICQNNYTISAARANEGDVTSLLRDQDKIERFSSADETNLNSKETIYLTFDNVEDSNNLGLFINFRQTLLTTYLFYSAMGYMGDQVSDIFALLEEDPALRNNFDATTQLLGGIEIYSFNEKFGEWEIQNNCNETGPIAINKQLIPLDVGHDGPQVKLKIILNKGLWRLDYVSLTNIQEKIIPLEISPSSVLNKGDLDEASLEDVINQEKYLISMPGSKYTMNFDLPNKNTNYELFLYSKGYYLEWMREHWIKDKNILKLNQMVFQPEKFLKDEANSFKGYETSMEEQFWNSKVDTKTFSYYDK